MKKGFTIIEVSILLVIFLIVAFLVIPLSPDDTKQAGNTSKWKSVQNDFVNIFYAAHSLKQKDESTLEQAFDAVIKNDIKGSVPPYRIVFMDGTYPSDSYRFKNFKYTYSNAVIAYKIFENNNSDLMGILMYDVNGKNGPNIWGKDVFGMNIYENGFEPFCKTEPIANQKKDCSKNGSGVCCSNYYLIGGSFD